MSPQGSKIEDGSNEGQNGRENRNYFVILEILKKCNKV